MIRRARVVAGETVAVFGGGGGLGIHMVMLANWAHADVIAVETKSEKYAACREAGARDCVDGARNDLPEALMELTGGKGIDVAIDFVGSESTLAAAVAALGTGGRLMSLSASAPEFSVPTLRLRRQELEIMGSRYASRQEVVESLELVARGDVWPLVTEIGKLEDAEAIHERLEGGLITGRAALKMV